MSKHSIAAVVALTLAASLAACASPTPYQPNIPGQATKGGFSEQRIESNRWVVSFAGNSLTSRDTVEGYLLFRAAELTREQGYDWFAMVERHTERDVRTYAYPDPLYSPWYGPGFGYWRPSWRYYGSGFGWRGWDPYWGDPFWAGSVDIQTIQQFQATAEIQMGKGPKPAADPRAYDAAAVIANLQPRIKYPEPKH